MKGKVVGINRANADAIKKEIISASNNWQKLNPPFILYPEEFELEGKFEF